MKPIFRNAMFGFHKEDVANFISKQNHQYETRTAELHSQIEELNRCMEAEKVAHSEQLIELEQLRAQQAEHSETLSGLLASALPLKEKAEEISVLLKEEADLARNLEADVQKLQKCADDSEAYRKKANRFDQLAQVLGEIVSGKTPERKAEPEVSVGAPERVETQLLLQHITAQEEALSALRASVDEVIHRLSELSEKA